MSKVPTVRIFFGSLANITQVLLAGPYTQKLEWMDAGMTGRVLRCGF